MNQELRRLSTSRPARLVQWFAPASRSCVGNDRGPLPSRLRRSTSHGPNRPVLTGKCPLDIFPGARTPKGEGRGWTSDGQHIPPHPSRPFGPRQMWSFLYCIARHSQSLPTAVGRWPEGPVGHFLSRRLAGANH